MKLGIGRWASQVDRVSRGSPDAGADRRRFDHATDALAQSSVVELRRFHVGSSAVAGGPAPCAAGCKARKEGRET